MQKVFLISLVLMLMATCSLCDLIDVSLTGSSQPLQQQAPPPQHQQYVPTPLSLRQVSNIQHFSTLLSDAIVSGDSDKFLAFVDEKTEILSFPFQYRYEKEETASLTFSATGRDQIAGAINGGRAVFSDIATHCSGKVFRSGAYEACESMFLIVQNGHWLRMQVHGITVLNTTKSSKGPIIRSWTSYFNHNLLALQTINELTADEYRARDGEGFLSSTTPVGVSMHVLNKFMAAHEVIAVNYYSVHYLSTAERTKRRNQYQPEFFIPVIFNETAAASLFTEDVEFAIPITDPVSGHKNAEAQYTEFMKNVERTYLYLEGPIQILPSLDQDIVRGAVPLTYLLYLKDKFPHNRVVCEGILLFEIDKSKSSKQFSSFKYIFNDDVVLAQMGNRNNVRVVASNRKPAQS